MVNAALTSALTTIQYSYTLNMYIPYVSLSKSYVYGKQAIVCVCAKLIANVQIMYQCCCPAEADDVCSEFVQWVSASIIVIGHAYTAMRFHV